MFESSVDARERAPGIFLSLALLSFVLMAMLFLPFGAQTPVQHSFRALVMRMSQPDTSSAPSAFDEEMTMSSKELLDRWDPFIVEASRRFGLPESWIRAVVRQESGGRTMSDETTQLTSRVGAMGVMQVMPETYNEMRGEYALGSDPYNPHDNIIAGSAYLRWLYKRYGFPKMFAAYNDGPGNFDKYVSGDRALPAETVAYLSSLSAQLTSPRRGKYRSRSA